MSNAIPVLATIDKVCICIDLLRYKSIESQGKAIGVVMTIKSKLLAGGVAISMALIAVLTLTLYTFGSLGDGFENIVIKSDASVIDSRNTEASIAMADESMSQITSDILLIADGINKSNMTVKMLEQKIKQLSTTQADLAKSLEQIQQNMPEGLARDTVEDVGDSVGDIEEVMRREALVALKETVNNMVQFAERMSARVDDIKVLSRELDKGSQNSTKVAAANLEIRELSKSFDSDIQVSRNTISFVLASVILVTLASAFIHTRAITKPLNRSIAIAEGIASGDLNQNVDIGSNDEFGKLGAAMSVMINNLRDDIEQTRNRADEATRIRLALDVGRTNVLVADKDLKIIYMNNSAKKTISEAEEAFKLALPDFDIDQIMGSDISKLHTNPEQQSKILQQLNAEHREELNIGGRSIRCYTNPVFGEDGSNLGVVMEFTDRTIAVSVQDDVASIVDAAKSGDLDQRVILENKEGFFLVLGERINKLLDVVSEAFDDVACAMNGLSQGDLSNKITRPYNGTYGAVKASVNNTIDSLQQIVTSIRESSDVISVAAREVMQGNVSMSRRTEQQAASLEETSSSTEELVEMVHGNAENAQTANRLASGTSEESEAGGIVIGDAINAMIAIRESSDKITEIVGVIDEIAFQTNLLALNASVEAARAGEHGRGFAVVATEVRNLAQRSAASAKEIKALIVDSRDKVRAGVDLVNHSGETLQAINSSVKKVGELISEIAASSKEQSHGLSQVNTAIRHMDESTQQNAALAEETSAASVSVSEQVDKMNKSLGFFKNHG